MTMGALEWIKTDTALIVDCDKSIYVKLKLNAHSFELT